RSRPCLAPRTSAHISKCGAQAYSASRVGTFRTARLSKHASSNGVHDLSLQPSIGLWLGCALALTGCVQLPFFGKAPVQAPRPASAPAPALPPSLDLPFVLGDRDDYVVRLVIGSVTCSGALIDDDRVLTAHHCVSARSRQGEMLPEDVAPEDVR